MNEKLTVGSCFSGIGGLELGLEWTGGFETKWQIEIDPYATKVLEKHWPTVKRYSDITTVERPPYVDVICGGFPCQDVSLAGARAGLEGKRSTLWGEMFRLICEIRPEWVEWLMGLPLEWTVLNASEMPSSPKSRKRSAK